MSGTGPEATGGPQAASDCAPPSAAAEGAAPQDAPKHLYDAAATQRDHVLDSFEGQRAAILQAVAEQREAALHPVRTVQARQAGTPHQAAPPSTAPLGAVRLPPGVTRQQAVATDIVMALKVMVAEEVRAQLVALLEAASQRQAVTTDMPSDAAADAANKPS